MPAFNEEATIGRAVEELLATDLPFSNELIVVDDGSEDGTADIVAGIHDPRLVLIRHEGNQGKGAALRDGFKRATGDVYPVFIRAVARACAGLEPSK